MEGFGLVARGGRVAKRRYKTVATEERERGRQRGGETGRGGAGKADVAQVPRIIEGGEKERWML